VTEFDELQSIITRENALALLAAMACPHCDSVGNYQLFDEINNNGVGIQCLGCGKYHPFTKQRIMWLRAADKRRSNDIVAVMKACGAYCYCCGTGFEALQASGVGMSVHHTRAFATHGERYAKIPLCTVCHEQATWLQRTMRRFVVDRRPPGA
jgi:hypothetical protein